MRDLRYTNMCFAVSSRDTNDARHQAQLYSELASSFALFLNRDNDATTVIAITRIILGSEVSQDVFKSVRTTSGDIMCTPVTYSLPSVLTRPRATRLSTGVRIP